MVQTRTAIVCTVSALLVGTGVGLFAKPARVETRVQTVERVVYQDKIIEKTATTDQKDTDSDKTKTVYVDRVVLKDGEVREHISTQYVDRVQTETKTVTIHDKADTITLHDTQTVTATKVVTIQPKWLVGVGVGASLGINPLSASPAYMAEAAYRVGGPFSVGVWATFDQTGLRPAGGAMLMLQF